MLVVLRVPLNFEITDWSDAASGNLYQLLFTWRFVIKGDEKEEVRLCCYHTPSLVLAVTNFDVFFQNQV